MAAPPHCTADPVLIADEAFADLLRKHGRPVDLKTALRQSGRDREATGGAIRAPS